MFDLAAVFDLLTAQASKYFCIQIARNRFWEQKTGTLKQ